MRLRCIGGPMDGAVYVLTKFTAEEHNRSTNRKPDRMGFDFIDDTGMPGHYEYLQGATAAWEDGVEVLYHYDGIVMDTTTQFETREQQEERQPEDRCAFADLGGWKDCQEAVKFEARRAEMACKFCRKELADAQSYADLAASGGLAGAEVHHRGGSGEGKREHSRSVERRQRFVGDD